MKLQQAYFNESNAYGGWTLIGYVGPGASGNATSTSTTNFNYTSSMAATVTATAATASAWSAANITKLNDCSPAAHWAINLNAAAEASDGYTAAINTDTNGGCAALTPSFTKLSIAGGAAAD